MSEEVVDAFVRSAKFGHLELYKGTQFEAHLVCQHPFTGSACGCGKQPISQYVGYTRRAVVVERYR